MSKLFIRTYQEFFAAVVKRLRALREENQTNCAEYQHLLLVHVRLQQLSDYIANGDWSRKSTRSKYVFWVKQPL